MLNRSGYFIVFEGIDGSGKSTLSSMTHEYLINSGVDSIKLFEPTSGKYGSEIRKLLSSATMPDTEKMIDLFILDRETDVAENIIPALGSGKIIIMDRYFYSNAAYQGAMGSDWKTIMSKNIEKEFPVPDRVYLIDIEPASALRRIKSRNISGEKEVFEKLEFLKKTRKNYLEMQNDKFMLIDGNDTPESIMTKIKNDLKVLLK